MNLPKRCLYLGQEPGWRVRFEVAITVEQWFELRVVGWKTRVMDHPMAMTHKTDIRCPEAGGAKVKSTFGLHVSTPFQ
jgi:hypothetical protein